MKKIIITIMAIFLVASVSVGQVKVNFNLQQARLDNGNLLVDVYATVPMSQTWNPGPTCLRFTYYTSNPANAMTLTPENPIANANTNLSGNLNYGVMTSTSILTDLGASVNVLLLHQRTPYTLNTGNHWLGTLKFAVTDSSACFRMTFLEGSAIFDNNTPLTYPTSWTFTNIDTCLILPSAIAKLETEIPVSYSLSQNYPNPFNPVTMIKFALPKASFVKLKVYDILGREVANLVNDFKSAGTYIVDFDASALSSGVYFYRLETEKYTDVKKMVVLK
jgi:hypothetical protein